MKTSMFSWKPSSKSFDALILFSLKFIIVINQNKYGNHDEQMRYHTCLTYAKLQVLTHFQFSKSEVL